MYHSRLGLSPFMQRMGTQRSRPMQAEGLVEEGKRSTCPSCQVQLVQLLQGACHSGHCRGSEGRVVREPVLTSPVSSAKLPCHLQHRPTVLLLLLWEIVARSSTGSYSNMCCCNTVSQPSGGTADTVLQMDFLLIGTIM